MIALDASDIGTIDVESSDGEEISNDSYKIIYEKLVETVNENGGFLRQISQLSKEKNELIKQVNSLKSGIEDT